MYLTGKWSRLLTSGIPQSIALTAENGAGGSGGGGGGGGNGGSGGTGGGSGFAQEQIDFLDQRMASIVNNAFTARSKKQKDEIIGEVGSLLDKKFAEFKPSTNTDDKDKDGAGKSGKDGGKNDVAYQTFQKQLESQKSELEMIKKERDGERAKNRNSELRRVMAEGLAKIGIKDAVDQKHAIAVLSQEGTVGYEDDASERIVWRDPTGAAFDADLGFRNWAKTEEAKRFMPAAGTRGSGSGRGAGMGANGGGNSDPKEVESRAWAALADEL